jgi:hypothetical protein
VYLCATWEHLVEPERSGTVDADRAAGMTDVGIHRSCLYESISGRLPELEVMLVRWNTLPLEQMLMLLARAGHASGREASRHCNKLPYDSSCSVRHQVQILGSTFAFLQVEMI